MLFCYTNLQILDSIWVVIAQMFCMLQPTMQHYVKKVFVFVDEPKYTRNTSVYRVIDFVCIIQAAVNWIHYKYFGCC